MQSTNFMNMKNKYDVMLILEGTYPFNGGGVSTWAHMLCNQVKNVNYTLYSINADFDEIKFAEDIYLEIENRGWKVRSVIRVERGVLPIPLESVQPCLEDRVIDLQGIIHDTTGYSLPDAVRVIEKITQTDLSYENVNEKALLHFIRMCKKKCI